MSSHAVVQVILRSRATIKSPIITREEGEAAVAEIGDARESGDSVKLPWINVSGIDVEAVHLEVRHAPSAPRVG